MQKPSVSSELSAVKLSAYHIRQSIPGEKLLWLQEKHLLLEKFHGLPSFHQNNE